MQRFVDFCSMFLLPTPAFSLSLSLSLSLSESVWAFLALPLGLSHMDLLFLLEAAGEETRGYATSEDGK